MNEVRNENNAYERQQLILICSSEWHVKKDFEGNWKWALWKMINAETKAIYIIVFIDT